MATLPELMRLAYADPAKYKRARVTTQGIETIKTVLKYRTMTSAKLADLHSISLQSASRRLTILMTDNWLQREEKPDHTGGIRFVYKCDPEKWGK